MMSEITEADHRAALLEKKWLAAWCHLHSDTRAMDGLVRKGFAPFSPSRAVTIRHAGKKMLVRRPLFPRYVLIGVDDDQPWYPILSTPGVAGLITNDQKPVMIPKWVMERLLEADAMQAFDGPRQKFERGQKVEIVSGPVQGFVAEIMRTTESRRITVLLEMFGKQQKLTLGVDQVKAA